MHLYFKTELAGPVRCTGRSTEEMYQPTDSTITRLDLLVREAIQNSSDAAINEKGDSFKVYFTTGKFKSGDFNKLLDDDACDVLNERYHGGNDRAQFLEIRDTGTSGLTGSVKIEDIYSNWDHGNYGRLIFDVGIGKAENSTGGNHGVGKTMYCDNHVGLGIVIYYSRIKIEHDDYEERLIVTLNEKEHETDKDGNDATLLGQSVEKKYGVGRYTGKSWWGREDEVVLDGYPLPLTDDDSIQTVLSIFEGIDRFKKDETGTSIIIPYVDSKGLLDAIKPRGDVRDDRKKAFVDSFASDESLYPYLKLAVQKWYAPRIQNNHLSEYGKRLEVYIGGKNPFENDREMYAFFKLIQELYTTAFYKANVDDGGEYKSDIYEDIMTLDIGVNNYFVDGNTVGYVSVLRIAKEKINDRFSGMTPYEYIGHFDAEQTAPILMYAREPGMIINYDVSAKKSGMKNLEGLVSDDEYLVAFFVPNTSKKLVNVAKKRKDEGHLVSDKYLGKTLGYYLRDCETSAHMSWNDVEGMEIVTRIKTNIRDAIWKNMRSRMRDAALDAKPSMLSELFGNILLPEPEYEPGECVSHSKSRKTGSEKAKLCVNGIKFIDNDLIVSFTLTVPNTSTSGEFEGDGRYFSVYLEVSTESGLISSEDWQKDKFLRFPACIKRCSVNSIKLCSGKSMQRKLSCDSSDKISPMDDLVQFELAADNNGEIDTKVLFKLNDSVSKIEGEIELHAENKKYEIVLSMS